MNRILLMMYFSNKKIIKVNGQVFNFDPKRIKSGFLSQKYGFSIEECFMWRLLGF